MTTTKNLIKNFFIKNGGIFITTKETRVYQQGRIIYNSKKEGMYLRFSSIEYDRKYIINNLNKIMALTIINDDNSSYDYFFPLPPPK